MNQSSEQEIKQPVILSGIFVLNKSRYREKNMTCAISINCLSAIQASINKFVLASLALVHDLQVVRGPFPACVVDCVESQDFRCYGFEKQV